MGCHPHGGGGGDDPFPRNKLIKLDSDDSRTKQEDSKPIQRNLVCWIRTLRLIGSPEMIERGTDKKSNF